MKKKLLLFFVIFLVSYLFGAETLIYYNKYDGTKKYGFKVDNKLKVNLNLQGELKTMEKSNYAQRLKTNEVREFKDFIRDYSLNLNNYFVKKGTYRYYDINRNELNVENLVKDTYLKNKTEISKYIIIPYKEDNKQIVLRYCFQLKDSNKWLIAHTRSLTKIEDLLFLNDETYSELEIDKAINIEFLDDLFNSYKQISYYLIGNKIKVVDEYHNNKNYSFIDAIIKEKYGDRYETEFPISKRRIDETDYSDISKTYEIPFKTQFLYNLKFSWKVLFEHEKLFILIIIIFVFITSLLVTIFENKHSAKSHYLEFLRRFITPIVFIFIVFNLITFLNIFPLQKLDKKIDNISKSNLEMMKFRYHYSRANIEEKEELVFEEFDFNYNSKSAYDTQFWWKLLYSFSIIIISLVLLRIIFHYYIKYKIYEYTILAKQGKKDSQIHKVKKLKYLVYSLFFIPFHFFSFFSPHIVLKIAILIVSIVMFNGTFSKLCAFAREEFNKLHKRHFIQTISLYSGLFQKSDSAKTKHFFNIKLSGIIKETIFYKYVEYLNFNYIKIINLLLIMEAFVKIQGGGLYSYIINNLLGTSGINFSYTLYGIAVLTAFPMLINVWIKFFLQRKYNNTSGYLLEEDRNEY